MIQSIRLTAKNNKSFFYYVTFSLIILMYIIFFNIKSFLPDDAPIFNTDFGKQVELGSTKLSIKNWEYNENKNFMEVQLNYADSGDSMVTNLNFTAKAKSDISKNLTVKTILNTDNTYIIHIENVPQNYGAIALKVSENSSSNVDTEDVNINDFNLDEVNTDSNNDSNNGEIANNSVTLYSDYRKVKINNNLTTETQKKYLATITDDNIDNIKNDIKDIDKKIKSNDNLIKMANKKIDSLKGQLKYEIDSEQETTNQEINSYNSKINQLNQQNDDLKQTKSLMKEKIGKLQNKLKDIAKKK